MNYDLNELENKLNKIETRNEELNEELKQTIDHVADIDESNVIEKDTAKEIKEVDEDSSSVKIKNDQDQQKLDEVKIESNNYDISKEDRTVNEMLNTEEDVFTSSNESDDLLKEEPNTPSTEQTQETITTMEESNSEETPINVEDIPEKNEETEDKQQVKEEKAQLTEEEKKKTDLSEIFNFGKR